MNTVDSLRTQLAVAKASSMARSGDLDTATRMLTGLDTPIAWDLLARVHAQSGDLDAADACWTRVQAAEPDHAGAAAGRRTIADIRARHRPGRPVLRPSRAAAVAAVALAGMVTAVVVLQPPAGTATASTPDIAAVRARQANERADQLARKLAADASARDAETARRAATLDAIAARLAQPGTLIRRTPNSVEALFTEGLFRAGGQLTPAGTTQLRQLASRLAGVTGSITVIGQTVAVPGGPAGGGSTVAMDRALIAARELAEGSGLPLTAFTLASGDQATPPFADPAQDRTVVVRISEP